jgi:Flp pilus assembly protein TadD
MTEEAPLGHPDIFHLRAAIGWMELGNPTEAAMELERIAPEHRAHREVLCLRLGIAMHIRDWVHAESTARRLIELHPHTADGWIGLAYARRRLPDGGVKSAYETLVPVSDTFAKEPIVPFNLACYACQLGELERARAWLVKSLQAGGEKPMREMALQEEDLKPLWPWIRGEAAA